MRVLYIDIDSLRPDHLGCYGYHRNTSPNIDALAARGVRFTNYYASDAPCLPSRTALFTARFGIHTGVINHGGLEADIRPQGRQRRFNNHHSPYQPWVDVLRGKGMHTAFLSPFASRHAAWHVLDGFLEVQDTGKNGLETAAEVATAALAWLRARAADDNWFLYVNFWDPHTPYRTPEAYGNPFEHDPVPAWLTEERIGQHRASFGPMSAREVPAGRARSGVPKEITCLDDFKAWIDAYDTAIRYVDDHVGLLLDELKHQGVLDDTVVIVSADHGENQGELNIYGDHHTADYITARIPLIVAGPGIVAGRVDHGFHYNVDLGPTLVELVGGEPRPKWDGASFLPVLTRGEEAGRPYLVVSQAAWSCQRSVRFDRWMLIRTYHPGMKDFPKLMLFDVANDPHETENLADARPDIVGEGLRLLDEWVAEQMVRADDPTDPMWHVIHEGGPYHTRGREQEYLERLRREGRPDAADRLAARLREYGLEGG